MPRMKLTCTLQGHGFIHPPPVLARQRNRFVITCQSLELQAGSDGNLRFQHRDPVSMVNRALLRPAPQFFECIFGTTGLAMARKNQAFVKGAQRLKHHTCNSIFVGFKGQSPGPRLRAIKPYSQHTL